MAAPTAEIPLSVDLLKGASSIRFGVVGFRQRDGDLLIRGRDVYKRQDLAYPCLIGCERDRTGDGG